MSTEPMSEIERLRFDLKVARAELAKADAENNSAGERARQAEAERDALRHEFEEMTKLHDAKHQDWCRAEAERDALKAELAEANEHRERLADFQVATIERNQQLLAELAEARAAIERVRERHWLIEGGTDQGRCNEDDELWPCRTIAALDASHRPEDTANARTEVRVAGLVVHRGSETSARRYAADVVRQVTFLAAEEIARGERDTAWIKGDVIVTLTAADVPESPEDTREETP